MMLHFERQEIAHDMRLSSNRKTFTSVIASSINDKLVEIQSSTKHTSTQAEISQQVVHIPVSFLLEIVKALKYRYVSARQDYMKTSSGLDEIAEYLKEHKSVLKEFVEKNKDSDDKGEALLSAAVLYAISALPHSDDEAEDFTG